MVMKWVAVYFELLMAGTLIAFPFLAGGGWWFVTWAALPLPIVIAITIAREDL